MPVIYINGENDPLVPAVDVYRAARETPGSKVKIFKGCKHWSVKEQPKKFCKIVDSVFNDL